MKAVSKHIKKQTQELTNAECDDTPPSAKTRIRNKVLAAILGRTGKGVKAPSKTPGDRQIVHNARYGHLTVDKTRMLRNRKVRMYHTVCDCGAEKFLSATQLLKRRKLEAGCLGLRCPFSPAAVKLWHNPEFALWFQLRQLQGKYPSDLDNLWGGQGFPDLPVSTEEDAFSNLLEFAAQEGSYSSTSYWIHKIHERVPYAPSNVVFKDTPDRRLFAGNTLYVVSGGFPVRLRELAHSLGVPMKVALELAGRKMTSDEFIEALIKETDNVR